MHLKYIKYIILIGGGALAGGILGWMSQCAGGGT
jgi:hypothetical protein